MSDNQGTNPTKNKFSIIKETDSKKDPSIEDIQQEKQTDWLLTEKQLKQSLKRAKALGKNFNLTSPFQNKNFLNKPKLPCPSYSIRRGQSHKGFFNTVQSVGYILNQFKKPKSDLSIKTMTIIKSKTGVGFSNEATNKPKTTILQNWEDPGPIGEDGGRLFNLFLKAFTNQNLNYIDVSLSKIELEILNAFLYRKFFKRISEEEFLAGEESFTHRLSIILNRSSKRTEECYKYLLSKFFKFLKNKSGLSSREMIREDDDEAVFYNFLFGETARRLGVGVEEFYFPSKSLKAKKQNTLNKDYFAKIFRSRVFNQKLRSYMGKELIKEHREDVETKLRALFDKWMVKFKYTSEKRRVNSILKDIKKNKRLKFPWIYCELEESVKKVEELMEQYEGK